MKEYTKVFFFCPALIAGGLERVLSVLSGPLANHYDEVTYITWHDREVFYEIDKNVRVVCVERECGSRSVWKRMLWLRGFVKKGRPDVLVSFSAPFNMIALVSLIGAGIKVVVSERNDPAHFRWGKIAKMIRNCLYLSADGLLVQTKTSQDHFWDVLARRSVILPNPIMIDEEYKGVALKTDAMNVIASVGRLVPQKRFDLLINAFGTFLKRHADYQLHIYGEGKEEENLQYQISEMGLEGKVLLMGTVDQILECIKHAKMFVMTSEYEGMSNALLEAMSIGLPCISTKVSGAIDIIRNGENGLLIDGGMNSAVDAMTALADDESLRFRLGENACRIADDYNLLSVSRQWMGYLDNFIGS